MRLTGFVSHATVIIVDVLVAVGLEHDLAEAGDVRHQTKRLVVSAKDTRPLAAQDDAVLSRPVLLSSPVPRIGRRPCLVFEQSARLEGERPPRRNRDRATIGDAVPRKRHHVEVRQLEGVSNAQRVLPIQCHADKRRRFEDRRQLARGRPFAQAEYAVRVGKRDVGNVCNGQVDRRRRILAAPHLQTRHACHVDVQRDVVTLGCEAVSEHNGRSVEFGVGRDQRHRAGTCQIDAREHPAVHVFLRRQDNCRSCLGNKFVVSRVGNAIANRDRLAGVKRNGRHRRCRQSHPYGCRKHHHSFHHFCSSFSSTRTAHAARRPNRTRIVWVITYHNSAILGKANF